MSAILGQLHLWASQEESGSKSQEKFSQCEKRTLGHRWKVIESDVECFGVSRRPADFYASDDVIVMIDGECDWLDENKDDIKGFIEEPAKIIADLYRKQNLDWLSNVQGSFALVIVDKGTQKIHLVRDKFGTKPIYYALTNRGWAFGSRVAGLQIYLDKSELDHGALSEVVHYRWLVGDKKLLDGVKQVLPSHVVTLGKDKDIKFKKYWELRFQSKGGELASWVDKLDEALHDYFGRMAKRYDTAGVLLSAGVDSSLLAAIASKHFKKTVAVTPKWSHGANPELKRALSFSEHLGIEHITPEVTDEDLLTKYREILDRAEEPCRYYHAMALYKALDAFPKEVEAVMYGEAADTLFGSRVVDVAMAFRGRKKHFRHIPTGLQSKLDKLIPEGLPGKLGRLKQYASLDYETFCHRVHALETKANPQSIFPQSSLRPKPNPALLSELMSIYDDPVQYVQSHMVYTSIVSHFETIDKMASGHGFDMLHPFICNDMCKAASGFPAHLQIISGNTKPVLRDLAARYYPREWVYEKKIGFRVPTLEWLQGPLQNEMKILEEEQTRARGIIDCERLLQLPLKENFELYYTAMGLERIMRQFKL